jgi:hypothetical protein
LEIDASRGGSAGDFPVAVANPQSQAFANFDQTLALSKVFNVTPQIWHTRNQDIPLDPLGRIQPQSAGASARMFRGNPILASAENYLEVQFNVLYPTRFEYNYSSGFYESFYPMDWLEFELWACQANGSCRSVAANISSRIAGTQPCPIDAPPCERSFSAKIPGSRLPAGGVEHSDFYKIVVKGTEEAEYRDGNGYARLCSVNDDCTTSHPYCVAGLCSAVTRPTDYFRVETPQALRDLR